MGLRLGAIIILKGAKEAKVALVDCIKVASFDIIEVI